MRNFSIFVSLLFILFLTGCSNKQQLGGKVTYSDNGDPVIAGYVVFTTPTFQSRGAIKPDGTYTMSSQKNSDGIPPGQYQVYLGGTEEEVLLTQKDGSTFTKYIPRVAEKLTSPETSDLTFTVNGTTNTFDISVDRPKKNDRRK